MSTIRDERRGTALYVELERTLVPHGLTWEWALQVVRARPIEALLLPIRALAGPGALRAAMAERAPLDPAALPYRPEVLDCLAREKEAGRSLVLVADPGDEATARAVAAHLGLFEDVLAVPAEEDEPGGGRLERIRAHSGGAFAYLGDPAADAAVWGSAGRRLAVGPGRVGGGLAPPDEVVPVARTRPRDLLRALRPHQWAKNALLAVPLITSHRLGEPDLVLRVLIAIASFSLAASSVYVFNDLMDLPSDRRHHSKRRRPFASGAVSIPAGLALLMVLLVGSAALAALLPPEFAGILLLYLALTTTYSAFLKRKLMVDVICLASLYTIRILAGGLAIDVPVSNWLMAFSMFLFLSLALAKRYVELTRGGGVGKVAGRGYRAEDLDLVRSLGVSSGLMSVLVFALYIHQNDEVLELYGRPETLWLACPVMLYWITRVWFLAGRRELDDDPVVFALRDRVSYGAGLLVALILVLAL